MSAAGAVGGGVRASGRGTQFTCFTGTKVQVLTQVYIYIYIYIYIYGRGTRERERYSVYLLYWYKSTGADAYLSRASGRGAQFSCFTGTKVQVLTLKALLGAGERLLVTDIPDILLLG
jgi:hypothetical protein